MIGQRTILGLDPGLASLGWGVIRVSGSRLTFVASGTVTSPATVALADRLVRLHSALREIILAEVPCSVGVEETFVNKDQRSALKLAHARAIALLAPAQEGIPVSEYSPNLIKKSVVGSGHAGKDQVRLMVERLLPGAEIGSDHAADALAVAIAHAHLSETNARWTAAEAGR